MRPLFITLLVFIAQLSIAQNLKSGGPLKPEQAIMDIRHYTLTLDVDPSKKYIKGYTDIDFQLNESTNHLLFDLWHGYTVTEVRVAGKTSNFQQVETDLVRIDTKLDAGRSTVRIFYEGTPGVAERAPWTGGFQWEHDSKGNPWVSITCQSEGGKVFFPCKDHPSDEPNEGADLFISVPSGLTVAGPGLLIDQKSKDKRTTFHWKTNYTISNYCLVFNIGKYAKVSKTYTTIDGNRVPMDYYVLEENQGKAMHQLDMLERTTRILEKYFGEYPWAKEKIGMCETPHLGMEHQTMIAYGNQYRYTEVAGQDFDWLLNHEFGHEWWANKVTNRDWAHMWIQEGICTFGDALYIRDMAGEEAYLKRMQNTARQAQNKLPILQGEGLDSDQVYHGDIYGKGAFFMHTLRFVMGDETFFPTLKRLATDPQYTYDHTVTTTDVEQLFSSAHGQSLIPLFDLFLRTTNKLEVSVRQMDEETYRVQLLNLKMDIPIEITTDRGTEKVILGATPITVKSRQIPIIDPKIFYLKKVILE